VTRTSEVQARYVRRLLEMEPEEIAARVRERTAGLEIWGPEPWAPPPRPAAGELLERSFLFGPAEGRARVEAWRRERPEQATAVAAQAWQGLERWEVFGVPVRLAPGEVDWSRGDLRWVWELNRQAYLFTFARAYVLTGERVFAERVTALVRDWRRRNPYGVGVNWSSALEVGLRALSWLWSLPLVWPSDPALRDWLVGLYEHYQYLRNHLSIYTDPTNHLIGEAAALWILSVALPDLPGAVREERRAMELLRGELDRQVTADGVDREQSTGYQRFVLDFVKQVSALARKTGRRLPDVVEQRREAMEAFLAALGGAGAPAVGDGDDGRGAPLAEPEADLNWWLGLPPPRAESGGVFREGGYCYWEAGDLASLFDVGPLGLWPNASHGHADALSIQVRVGKRWLLGDPGTGAYAANPRVRGALRGTAAHNTVTVDEADQAEAMDVFKWLRPVPARLLDTFSDRRCDYALAMHEGYRRLPRPVTHYRGVMFVRPPAPNAGWVIQDRLVGEGRHHCALRFHFPPEVELRAEDSRAVRAVDSHGGVGLRMSFSEAGWRVSEGLWSRRFGQWESAPVVTLERTVTLPLVWWTFLTPLR
jgi:uncharacterized heparinase superfamily protein